MSEEKESLVPSGPAVNYQYPDSTYDHNPGSSYQAGFGNVPVQSQPASFAPTNYYNVPYDPKPQAAFHTPWNSGICNCGNDAKSCLLTMFCGGFFLGNLATRLGESFMYGYCCAQHFNIVMRPYVRAKHNIEGTLFDDCCLSVCCTCCSICQVSRELDKRGYPPGCMC